MKVLSRSLERGINICCTEDMRRVFVLGHFEYDRETLATEYIRDKKKGMDPDLPEYYYPDNDSTEQPVFKWCSYAHLFYTSGVADTCDKTLHDRLAIRHWMKSEVHLEPGWKAGYAERNIPDF